MDLRKIAELVLSVCADCGELTSCRSFDNSVIDIKKHLRLSIYLFSVVGRRIYLCQDYQTRGVRLGNCTVNIQEV